MVYIGLAFSLRIVEEQPLARRGSCSTIRVTSSLQVLQRDALLVQVDPLGTAGQPAHQREVAADAAHHLDDEAAPWTRVPDCLIRSIESTISVQRGVGADAQLRAGHVVVDASPAGR